MFTCFFFEDGKPVKCDQIMLKNSAEWLSGMKKRFFKKSSSWNLKVDSFSSTTLFFALGVLKSTVKPYGRCILRIYDNHGVFSIERLIKGFPVTEKYRLNHTLPVKPYETCRVLPDKTIHAQYISHSTDSVINVGFVGNSRNFDILQIKIAGDFAVSVMNRQRELENYLQGIQLPNLNLYTIFSQVSKIVKTKQVSVSIVNELSVQNSSQISMIGGDPFVYEPNDELVLIYAGGKIYFQDLTLGEVTFSPKNCNRHFVLNGVPYKSLRESGNYDSLKKAVKTAQEFYKRVRSAFGL